VIDPSNNIELHREKLTH